VKPDPLLLLLLLPSSVCQLVPLAASLSPTLHMLGGGGSPLEEESVGAIT